MTTLRRLPLGWPVAAALLLLAGPALAQPACIGAQRKIDEAGALRFQARQDARLGDRDRVCDNLGDAEDRYEDARDRLDECGLRVASIDLKSALRSVRQEKRFFRCD
ncbi:hypothetical protein VQ02_03130 [Methylobacterium variabile]|jgi:hypothetical protein|uniref:Uncharacterized protein n=1 Tax=Methylobacterium variabile TaxID=298794 RepID=A0A0J6T4H3_9HYPH|nr:hypothetical protein [Methylobacterium variabile]KMO42340.1 hypothetical protein VQ02_03130 [Methylobacterium variabile]